MPINHLTNEQITHLLICPYTHIPIYPYTHIHTLFIQNKPNFLESQMSVSAVKTMNYEQIIMNNANKNKPKTNPIKANLVRRRRIANERKLICYKGL